MGASSGAGAPPPFLLSAGRRPPAMPNYLRGGVAVGAVRLGVYRLFLASTAVVIALALMTALEWTRFGARVRAAVDNQRMARGLGIDVDRVFAITFALGSRPAGLR